MKKILILLVIAAAIFSFFYFDLGSYLTLENLKAQQANIDAAYQANPLLIIGAFFAVYVVVTALSIPGAAIMTLAAGAIFDLLVGTIVVSFASTIGATIAFLISRYLLGDWVESKFGDRLKKLNEGIQRDGAFYLISIRLVPAFPFFVVNMLMGLTKIRLLTYFIASQIGMFAGTIVFVNAGTQLAQVDSVGGVFTVPVIGSFLLLALFPWIAKFALKLFKKNGKVPAND